MRTDCIYYPCLDSLGGKLTILIVIQPRKIKVRHCHHFARARVKSGTAGQTGQMAFLSQLIGKLNYFLLIAPPVVLGTVLFSGSQKEINPACPLTSWRLQSIRKG